MKAKSIGGGSLAEISKALDQLAGMFSNAELARATNGKLEMHNLTTCCVAIKEK